MSKNPHLTFFGCLLLVLIFQACSSDAKWIWQEDTQDSAGANSISFSDIILRPNVIQSKPSSSNSHLEQSNEALQDAVAYLDVLHPDSPYGLIQDVLQPVTKETSRPNYNLDELNGLEAKDVWLADGDLLVLKGIDFFFRLVLIKKLVSGFSHANKPLMVFLLSKTLMLCYKLQREK